MKIKQSSIDHKVWAFPNQTKCWKTLFCGLWRYN